MSDFDLQTEDRQRINDIKRRLSGDERSSLVRLMVAYDLAVTELRDLGARP